jgi:hypothetical protein
MSMFVLGLAIGMCAMGALSLMTALGILETARPDSSAG